MATVPSTGPLNGRPDSPMQLENDDPKSSGPMETSSDSIVDPTRVDMEPAAPGPKKSRKKPGKSRNARPGSAGPSVPVDVDGEPAYRLTRVQKIVKMNDQALISREAVFVMALAAEEITRRLTRAGCDVAKSEQRHEMSLADVATAVMASTSLSFLAEIIPQTIPLSTARARRLTKDTTPFPPDPTQTMISRVQDTLRQTARPLPPYPAHKMGNPGGIGTPVAVMMTTGAPAPGTVPARNYSPREARAIANSNSKTGQASNGRGLANPMPVAVGPMMPPMTLPPGFDYRALGMPQPPPGMTFHAIDPESYRNGIRWAPVQAGGETGSAQEGAVQLPPGVWTDASGQFVVPASAAPYPALPNQLVPAQPQSPRSTRRASSSSSNKSPATARQNQSQNVVASLPSPPSSATTTSAAPPSAGTTATSPKAQGPGSPFQAGQLHGRTIYSTDTGGANSGAFASEAPKSNGTSPSVPAPVPTSAKKKRASTKGRGAKKALGEDAMDLNP